MEKVKVAKLSKQTKEANIIMEILSEMYEDTQFKLHDTGCISFPLGLITSEKGLWIYDVDFTFCTERIDMFMVMIILQKIIEQKINIIVSFGVKTLFDKNGVYTGLLFQDEINELVEKDNITEKEAENILKKKTIKEFKEAMKQGTVKSA